MKQLTGKMKTRFKIVGATATAVFSLATVFTATYAWFASNSNVSATDMQVKIAVSKGCEIKSISLIKFDYYKESFTNNGETFYTIDYMQPKKGKVNRYYSFTKNNTFGAFESDSTNGVYYVDVAAGYCLDVSTANDYVLYKTDSYTWKKVEDHVLNGSGDPTTNEVTAQEGKYYFDTSNNDLYKMGSSSWGEAISESLSKSSWKTTTSLNVYDPADSYVRKSSLFDLNCNGIYEVEFDSTDTWSLNLMAELQDVSVSALRNEILLSDCVDFCVYYENDLNNAGLANKVYYPKYKSKVDNELEPIDNPSAEQVLVNNQRELERLFYKFSYMSALSEDDSIINRTLHKAFEPSGSANRDDIMLDSNPTVQPLSGNSTFKVYVNVNYIPEKLEEYLYKVYKHSYIAKCDYIFDFMLSPSNGE